MCGCVVWSVPLLFACSKVRFSHDEVRSYQVTCKNGWPITNKITHKCFFVLDTILMECCWAYLKGHPLSSVLIFRPLKRLSLQLWTFFEKNFFSFKIICKSRIKLRFHNKSVHYSWKLHVKVNYLIKTGVFLLLVIICVPPIIIGSQFLT